MKYNIKSFRMQFPTDAACLAFLAAKSGVAAKEMERQIIENYKCVARVTRQIRLLMADE